jgi:hypothetical protein
MLSEKGTKLLDPFFFFFFFWGNGVWTQSFRLAKQALFSPFCSGYFRDRVSRTIWQGWPQTTTLPISASQVARITSVSHHCLLDSSYIACLKRQSHRTGEHTGGCQGWRTGGKAITGSWLPLPIQRLWRCTTVLHNDTTGKGEGRQHISSVFSKCKRIYGYRCKIKRLLKK